LIFQVTPVDEGVPSFDLTGEGRAVAQVPADQIPVNLKQTNFIQAEGAEIAKLLVRQEDALTPGQVAVMEKLRQAQQQLHAVVADGLAQFPNPALAQLLGQAVQNVDRLADAVLNAGNAMVKDGKER
jgi:hypothetical protein